MRRSARAAAGRDRPPGRTPGRRAARRAARTRWVDVVKEMGLPGLHFHDLRHTGNMLAAESGAGLKDLTARMGHDNVRAAMIYQHAVRGADKTITDAIDRHISGAGDEDGSAVVLVPVG
ncbi:tyrosine-type recombinase/integrase [Microbispora siamensis]